MAEGTQYGGFWARFVALLLDNAIVFFIVLALLLSLGAVMAAAGMDGTGSLMGVVASVVMTLVPLLYWPVLESSRRRATIGKRILGLEVTDLEGNRLGFLRALLRSLAKIISIIPFGIGFLIAAFTARKQALHDIIVKTLVVRTGPSQLWKVVLALIVGLVLMIASGAGLFYFVVMPMFKKGMDDTMKEVMKGAPPMTRIPAPGPVVKAPPQAKPAAPAPQAAAPATPGAKEGPDPEFDAIIGKPLTGLEKPGTTRAGPAILEIAAMFPSSFWVKAYVPVPAIGDPEVHPGLSITVNRVLDAGGNNFYDAGSTFEKDFFRRPSLSFEKTPVPHFGGTRQVQIKPGLSEQALQKVEGLATFTVPVDPRPVTFAAKETGKEKPVHDSFVSLQSVNGNAATLHFRGASENLLLVRGYGADGKALAFESRQILPERHDVDDDFTIAFKGAPAKVEVMIASKVIERFYPFSLARGAVAGPPSTATGGATMPPRARASKVAAAPPEIAPAPARAPAPVMAAPAKPQAAAKPDPISTPKAEPKPAAEPKAQPARVPAPAKSVEARRSAPEPRPGLAPPPAPPERAAPKFNDVMTAVLYRDPAAVTELLDMGRWVDKRDSNGLTPLMAAVRLRDVQTAQVLIRRGADVNASAAGGKSPLSLARENGDAAMLDLLQKSGAR